MKRTRVKICGLTREQDVDAAAEAGADAVGFVLYEKSARHVPLKRAAELAARLPPFVTPVLLFVNESPTKVALALRRVPGALAQLHGHETPEECAALRRPYIRAAHIPTGPQGHRFDLVKFVQDYTGAQAILLDTQSDGYGGSGQVFNWSLIPKNVGIPLVLSGGLTPANVAEGIAQIRPWAVDVSSGVESAKGIKDDRKIRDFISAVRNADTVLEWDA